MTHTAAISHNLILTSALLPSAMVDGAAAAAPFMEKAKKDDGDGRFSGARLAELLGRCCMPRDLA
jgi:hypothetical protein